LIVGCCYWNSSGTQPKVETAAQLLDVRHRKFGDTEMTYRGHVQNGVVVFDGSQVPPNGASVEVAIVASGTSHSGTVESLSEMLLRHAGKAIDLPNDMAENHDRYLHGIPRQ
jgi:hypothetical protein